MASTIWAQFVVYAVFSVAVQGSTSPAFLPSNPGESRDESSHAALAMNRDMLNWEAEEVPAGPQMFRYPFSRHGAVRVMLPVQRKREEKNPKKLFVLMDVIDYVGQQEQMQAEGIPTVVVAPKAAAQAEHGLRGGVMRFSGK